MMRPPEILWSARSMGGTTLGPTLRNAGLVAILRMARPTGPSTLKNGMGERLRRDARRTQRSRRGQDAAMDWRGKHVVITGGSSGIGEALAMPGRGRGAKLTLLARGRRGGSTPWPPHWSTAPRHRRRRRPVRRERPRGRSTPRSMLPSPTRGPVDVLVCSAGITLPGRFLEADDQTFRDMIDVDYYGTLWPMRAVAPSMVDRRTGSIIGVASAAALVGVYGYSAYGAAKFAVRGLLEIAAHRARSPRRARRLRLPARRRHPDARRRGGPGEAGGDQGHRRVDQAHLGRPGRRSRSSGASSKRQAEIYADAQTRALARTVALAPGIYRRLFDQRVRKTSS